MPVCARCFWLSAVVALPAHVRFVQLLRCFLVRSSVEVDALSHPCYQSRTA
jgi:hypothetical protein